MLLYVGTGDALSMVDCGKGERPPTVTPSPVPRLILRLIPPGEIPVAWGATAGNGFIGVGLGVRVILA